MVTNPINILYLTGFKGVSPTEREAILVFNPKPTLITAMLYLNEANFVKSKHLSTKVVRERNQLNSTITKLLSKANNVGFEEKNLTYSEFKEFKKNLKGKKLIPAKNLVEDMRLVKTEDEIQFIEKAQTISKKAFQQILKTLKVGQTEEEIAGRLKQIIIGFGADGLAFDSIVASGHHANTPHHVNGKRKIKKGEVLLFDFGAKHKNYCADLSRTIFIGKAKDEQKNVYMHVATAQENAIKNITANLKASDVYNHANNVFKEKKLEKYFLHGLGHGIGLEVHEPPYLRKTTDQTLEENMVFSVEPGLYFPWGGVRIEDLVTIKNGKARVLGKEQKEIIEI